jgi:hypothetical protein
MINPHYLVLAMEKTTDPEARAHLKRIEAFARDLAVLERDFPNKVAANKSKRGDRPVKLSKEQKAVLADVDEDLADIDRESLARFESASSAREILEALTYELPGSPKDWSWMVTKAHPDDRPLIEEVISAQRALDEEMLNYLETYP